MTFYNEETTFYKYLTTCKTMPDIEDPTFVVDDPLSTYQSCLYCVCSRICKWTYMEILIWLLLLFVAGKLIMYIGTRRPESFINDDHINLYYKSPR